MQGESIQPPADALAAAPVVPNILPGARQKEATCHVPPVALGKEAPMVSYGSKQTDNLANPFTLPTQNRSRSTGCLAHRVTTGSGDVNERLPELVSFKGCEELLRGSHLSDVLRDQASIFAERNGRAADYGLSKPTRIIDAFISHNWCVSRWLKWLCLSLHFNLRIATVLTLMIVSPLCALAVYGWLPAYQPNFAPYPRSYVFKVTLTPIFLFLLCFYRAIVRCFPTWSPIVFLDKTCIHQEDTVIQRKAIGKLAGFLCCSKTMVVCYTDVYLTRLWTVYEAATFMALNSVEHLRVIPVMYPVVFVFSLVCIYTACGVGLLPELAFGFYYTVQIFLFVFLYGIMVVFRRWARSKFAIHRKVATFSVRHCQCLHEEDRPLVYANIVALMREIQGVGEEASEEAALDRFDKFVRNNLSGALVSSVGAYSMRYEHAVGVGGILAVSIVLDQLVGLAHGMSLREFCNYGLWYAVQGCFLLPLTFVGFSAWADHCMDMIGWREHMYLALGLVAVFMPITLARLALDLMESWANESDIGLALFVLILVVSSAVVRNAMNSSFSPKAGSSGIGHGKHCCAASEASKSEKPEDHCKL